MPITNIAVSTGQLANWTRFDCFFSPDNTICAIYKDRSILLSMPDDNAKAFGQMQAIWNKLGKPGYPVPPFYITRDMVGANAPLTAPLIVNSDVTPSTTSAVLTLKYPEGQAPDSVDVEALPVTVGLTFFQNFPLAFDPVTGDYPQTVTITGLSAGTQYDFDYQFLYNGGATPGIKSAKVRKSTL